MEFTDIFNKKRDIEPIQNIEPHISYDKLKDSKPLKTVAKIQSILADYDIATVQDWTKGQSKIIAQKPTYALNLMLNGINYIGSNGKGTSVDYALASAYGELIERIQGGFLILNVSREFEYTNHRSKFDKIFSKEEFSKIDNSFFNEHFLKMFERTYPEHNFPQFKNAKEVVDFLDKNFSFGENDCFCSEFYSYKDKKSIYIPENLLRKFVGSNGYSAGNTTEEALVQALSEVFERHVKSRIMLKDLRPPEIPYEIYSKYDEIKNIIQNYNNLGIDVKVCDASLGEGFPVIVTLFTKIRTGETITNFGSHPYLPIAIERTLTEVNQVDILSEFDAFSNEYFESAYFNKSIFCERGFALAGLLIDPKTLRKAPDWEFDKNTFNLEIKSNKSMLKDYLNLCEKNNYDIYIKDYSFLGFPTVNVYIPQISHPVSNFEAECFVHDILSIGQGQEIFKVLNYLKNNEKLDIMYPYCASRILDDKFKFPCLSFTPLAIALIAGYKLGHYRDLRSLSDLAFSNRFSRRQDFMETLEPIRTLVDSGEFDRLEPFMERLFNFCYSENLKEFESRKMNKESNYIYDYSMKNFDFEKKKLEKSFIEILKAKQEKSVDCDYLKEYFEELMKD